MRTAEKQAAASSVSYRMYTKVNPPSDPEKRRLVSFLRKAGVCYTMRMKGENIRKSVDYATGPYTFQGGFIMLVRDEQELLGLAVVNKTHMSGFAPANLLTCFSFKDTENGQEQLAKELLTRVLEVVQGDLALHIEPEREAESWHLFKEAGFGVQSTFLRLQADD